LLLACGQQASLDTTDSAARFRVEIRMPMYGSEPGLRG
jgi:hypothetical protein